MEDKFGDLYDLVVVGTGLTESIISCAAAKKGQKVLHLDSNDFYGSGQASFSYSSLLNEFHSGSTSFTPKPFVVLRDPVLKESELMVLNSKVPRSHLVHPSFISSTNSHNNFSNLPNIHPSWAELPSKFDILREKLIGDRDFNIDFYPQCFLSDGKLASTLIESGVSKYLEFKSCEAIFFFEDNVVNDENPAWKVPCSRNEIFSTSRITTMDKRALMKFQQFAADYSQSKLGINVKHLNEIELSRGRALHRPQNKTDSVQSLQNKTFSDVLNTFKLSDSLQPLILHVLCLESDVKYFDSPCEEMLDEMAVFLNSLAKFGNTPFLFPLYGISELIQGFCRMSSVWGSTFALRRGIRDVSVGDDESLFITDSSGQRISCRSAVINASYFPSSDISLKPCFSLIAKVFYGERFFSAERSIAIIPALFRNLQIEFMNSHAILLIENDCSTCSVPEGIFCLNIQTMIDDSCRECIRPHEWTARASQNGSSVINLIDKILSLLKIPPNQIVSQTIVLCPKYEAVQSIHPKLRFVGLNHKSSFSLDDYVAEATVLWKELFECSQMFEHSSDETDEDQPNQEEEMEYSELFCSLHQQEPNLKSIELSKD